MRFRSSLSKEELLERIRKTAIFLDSIPTTQLVMRFALADGVEIGKLLKLFRISDEELKRAYGVGEYATIES